LVRWTQHTKNNMLDRRKRWKYKLLGTDLETNKSGAEIDRLEEREKG